MSIGLKTPAGVVYLLETVTSLQESRTGQMATHPVEGGVSISDHVVVGHPVFNITSILSAEDFGADFIGGGAVSDLFQESLRTQGLEDAILIAKNPTTPVQIVSQGSSTLIRLLPEAATAFLDTTKLPEIQIQQTNPESVEDIKEGLIDIFSRSAPIDLIFINQNVVEKVVKNCVITSLTVSVSPDMGEALEVALTVEKPLVAVLKTTVIPTLTWKELQLNADPKKGKGKQTGATSGSPTSKQPPAPESADSFEECWRNFTGLVCFLRVNR